jgi:hypothetical protein
LGIPGAKVNVRDGAVKHDGCKEQCDTNSMVDLKYKFSVNRQEEIYEQKG